jgi:3-phenylpropionate/trans-cinnamate dioxygenase ferredoxin reductase subunit
VPWFWTNQFTLNVQMVGDLDIPWDTVTCRGDLAAADGIVFYQRDGELLAAVGVNRALDVRAAQVLLRRGARVTPESLGDADTDLVSLAS